MDKGLYRNKWGASDISSDTTIVNPSLVELVHYVITVLQYKKSYSIYNLTLVDIFFNSAYHPSCIVNLLVHQLLNMKMVENMLRFRTVFTDSLYKSMCQGKS